MKEEIKNLINDLVDDLDQFYKNKIDELQKDYRFQLQLKDKEIEALKTGKSYWNENYYRGESNDTSNK